MDNKTAKKQSKSSTSTPENPSKKSEKIAVFNLLGKPVEIESWKLDKKAVETEAKKFFKEEVTAHPSWIEPKMGCNLCGYLGVGWSLWVNGRADKNCIGYLLIDGEFERYPTVQCVYGLPIKEEKEVPSVFGVKVFYADGKIRFEGK